MPDTLFDDDAYVETISVPILRERKGPARGSTLDARFKNDYPPEWKRCPTCEGTGKTWGEVAEPVAEPREKVLVVWVTSGLGTELVLETNGKDACEIVEAGVMPVGGRRYVGDLVGFKRRDTTCSDCLGMGHVRGRVRLETGHRCIRCKHPYIPKGDAKMLGVESSWVPGCEGWTACDEQCVHDGPWRRAGEEQEQTLDLRMSIESGVEAEAAWRILTVHHFDGDKANLAWWNLGALCQRCHLEVQSKIVMERIWPHPHSEWFKPYVAAYYAHVYLCKVCGLQHGDPEANHRGRLGEPMPLSIGSINENGYYPHPFEPGLELTRDKTMERLDELLALELDPALA